MAEKEELEEAFNRFRAELEARLAPLTEELIPVLEESQARKYPKRVKSLEFRLIENDLDHQFPIVLDLNPNAPEELLPDAPPLCPADWFAAYEELDPESVTELACEIIIEWFAGGWRDAGGAASPLPAVIGTDESTRCYDLIAGHWLE